jgi:hypothetical protein
LAVKEETWAMTTSKGGMAMNDDHHIKRRSEMDTNNTQVIAADEALFLWLNQSDLNRVIEKLCDLGFKVRPIGTDGQSGHFLIKATLADEIGDTVE